MDVNKSGQMVYAVFAFYAMAAVIFLFFTHSIAAQTLWQDADSGSSVAAKNGQLATDVHESAVFKQARFVRLDESAMYSKLSGDSQSPVGSISTAAKAVAVSSPTKTVILPLPDGRKIEVAYQPDIVLPEVLADKYPAIKTFKLLPDDTILSGRLDFTPQGFHASVQLLDGQFIYIDPIEAGGNELKLLSRAESTDGMTGLYASYRKQDQTIPKQNAHRCELGSHDYSDHQELHGAQGLSGMLDQTKTDQPVLMSKVSSRTNEQLLQYRIAVAVTGEYTQLKGGTTNAALGAIVTSINRINQVYEQDLGIHLVLVENNDQIIFTDPGTDPYESGNLDQMLAMNQEVINNRIGAANYDVGHLFATAGGGLARIASACHDGSKAMGISATGNPGNDAFYLDFVAHEIGHQFGATHTFNSAEGLCAGSTRTSQTAYEPGSGSTIMSYAGICGTDNIQSHVDAMFHIGSIDQIREFTRNGNGQRCGVRYDERNAPPVPSAGQSYTIPANTPFKLVGSANDPDGDTLVYGWEQIDAGTASAQYEDKGDNALFRAHMPDRSVSRTFPPLHNLLTHTTPRGENLPVLDRELRFRFVAQDGINAAQSDETRITIKRTGSRFALNLPRAHYTLGEEYRLNWNRANTDKAPIHCDSVTIDLSTDGGYHFDHRLAENVPNTGEAWVYLAASLPETRRGRFRLSCSNNVFFAVSYRDFRLTLEDLEEADEPGPEPNLEDKSPGSIEPQPSKTPIINNNGAAKSGGGNVSPYLLMLLLILLGFRRRL